eukprot:6646868-Pyramimonas_sp.AAC.1
MGSFTERPSGTYLGTPLTRSVVLWSSIEDETHRCGTHNCIWLGSFPRADLQSEPTTGAAGHCSRTVRRGLSERSSQSRG